MRDLLIVAAGPAAWGLMTGVTMIGSGLDTVSVVAMGVLVFAGSSQLAALPLLTAHAPPALILATAFCVNLRFVVFSAHLRPYVMHLPLHRRLFRAYLMGDLNYVLFVRRFPTPSAGTAGRAAQDAYWMGLGVTGWVVWVLPSIAGMVLGGTVPVSWGLGFAGVLALIGILASLATSPLKVVSATIAGSAAVAIFAWPLRLNIVVAIAAASTTCLLLEGRIARRQAGDDGRSTR